jgi:hypothetical protein
MAQAALKVVDRVEPDAMWTVERVEAILFPTLDDGTRLYYGMNRRGRWAMYRKSGALFNEHHECTDEEFEALDSLNGIIQTWSPTMSHGVTVIDEWDWAR